MRPADPVDRIAALVVGGRYDDAITLFQRLPEDIRGVPYVRAANAASLAYAIQAAHEPDLVKREALLNTAIETFPNISRGRGRTPFDQREELEAAQAVVMMRIEALKAQQ
jgi:hypothetical protein